MYAYSSKTCAPYLGQMVMCRTKTGVHYGRVERITSQGLYMRPLTGYRPVAGDLQNDALTLEHAPQPLEADPVFWGGLFFIPFLSILALSTLWWW